MLIQQHSQQGSKGHLERGKGVALYRRRGGLVSTLIINLQHALLDHNLIILVAASDVKCINVSYNSCFVK